MNFFLLDSPVLVARYTLGPGYSLVDQLFAKTIQGRLCCSILSLAEVVGTFARLRRRGRYTPALITAVNLQFQWEVIQSIPFSKLPLDNAQVEASLTLIDKHGLDSFASILVKVCLDHAAKLRAANHDLILVSTGKRLLKVARAEGLLTFNPQIQTQIELDALLGP